MADITKRTQNWISSPAAQTVTNNGITVDCDGKGTYHIHGTTTDNAQFNFDVTPFTMTVNANIAYYNTVDTQRVSFGFMDGETSVAGHYLSPMNRVINNIYSLKNKEVNTVSIVVQHIQNGYTVDMYVSPLIYVYSLATPDTFEPYWKHSLWEMKSATETIQSGDTIYANGQPITTYNIKGNEEHTGTPSPQNPVMPNGVGNKTANLFDYKAATYGTWTNSNGSTISAGYAARSASLNAETITVSCNGETKPYSYSIVWLDGNDTFISREHVSSASMIALPQTFTPPNNAVKYYMQVANGADTSNPITESQLAGYKIMLNTGSTAQSFEPYGYKIPISNNQQTIDIYIGDLPLLKSLDGTAVDEISNGTLTRRVDSDGSVLPTPTTTQITMPSIPTTDGANQISIDTTVQPSEFSATWTGWHDSSVKEWDGSDWQ